MRRAALLPALLFLSCHKRIAEKLPDFTIPPACVKSVVGHRCDLRVSPPTCETTTITYKAGCETVVVK